MALCVSITWWMLKSSQGGEFPDWETGCWSDQLDSSLGRRSSHLGSCQLLQEDSTNTVITQRVKRFPHWRWRRQQWCTTCSALSTYSSTETKEWEVKERPPLTRLCQAPTQWSTCIRVKQIKKTMVYTGSVAGTIPW